MKKRNIKDILLGAVLTVVVFSLAVPVFASTGYKDAELWYDDISVVLNGDELVLRDGQGNIVEPFIIDGTTYLPLRAISGALGLDVDWNSSTSTVILETPDFSGSTGNSGNTNTGSYIGSAKARQIALNHAGVDESDATFVRSDLDYDDGVRVYEVEFWSNGVEYDYDIDALTGDVRSFDKDIENFSIPNNSQSSGDYIGESRAKELVREKAGISGGYFADFEFEFDDGRAVYEGELRDGRTEYEFTINAVTGEFIQWSTDWDD